MTHTWADVAYGFFVGSAGILVPLPLSHFCDVRVYCVGDVGMITEWSKGIDIKTKNYEEMSVLFDMLTDMGKIREVRIARGYHPMWESRMAERHGIADKLVVRRNKRIDIIKRRERRAVFGD